MEISICIEIIQYLLRMTACLINTTLCLFFALLLQVFGTIGIITIIKASQCGNVVSTLASSQGDPGSNPIAVGNLVKFILVWVFFNPSGILTQTFTPPPTETRLLFNHGPQYGSAVCHHSRRSGRRPQQQNPT